MKIELTVGETLLTSGFDGLGAIWAVAKAFNLYPPAPEELKSIDLVGRSHHKMYVIYQQVQTGEYLIDYPAGQPVPDIFIVVTGKMPDYELHGYVTVDEIVEVQADNKDERCFKVFHHILTEFVPENYFYELIDGTRIPLKKKH